jgi:hypothetical protein
MKTTLKRKKKIPDSVKMMDFYNKNDPESKISDKQRRAIYGKIKGLSSQQIQSYETRRKFARMTPEEKKDELKKQYSKSKRKN